MSWTIVPLGATPPVAWRNGGGLTRELLAWPSPLDWRIRMSVAEVVASGPFSSFPGVRRWFAVLAGNGVRLTVGDESHDLTPHSVPFEFNGGAATHCELLDGPTRDFNLMLRQGRARVERVAAPRSLHCRSATLVAAYAAGSAATVVCDGQQQELSQNTLAWRILDSDGQLELIATDALWMEIVP